MKNQLDFKTRINNKLKIKARYLNNKFIEKNNNYNNDFLI